ncbi:hypothetical protein HAX54_008110 [Datura stramonium]|uniref:Uncharacterized protein n=1 Tax=Datura stramonium TaxID=4076 RepID=A0ABS8WZ34_DATST|nr:hypothetical protein [Datura stramonium]
MNRSILGDLTTLVGLHPIYIEGIFDAALRCRIGKGGSGLGLSTCSQVGGREEAPLTPRSTLYCDGYEDRLQH